MDLCISRPIERLSWGIPLPFDDGYVVCYVWFDALLNYLTAAGYQADTVRRATVSRLDEARFNRLWPSAMHLVGKDILTTHASYWPTMLQALGLSQPRSIIAHGWRVSGGKDGPHSAPSEWRSSPSFREKEKNARPRWTTTLYAGILLVWMNTRAKAVVGRAF